MAVGAVDRLLQCPLLWEGRPVRRVVERLVLRMFSDDIHHIFSLIVQQVVLCAVYQRGKLHLRLSNFERMRELNDVCETRHVPAIPF